MVFRIAGGLYYYFGLVSKLKELISSDIKLQTQNTVNLQISTDGLPLFKSKPGQFWPLLGLIRSCSNPEPFIIGFFYGKEKPSSAEEFLRAFVSEIILLQSEGLHHNGQVYSISISFVICDGTSICQGH